MGQCKICTGELGFDTVDSFDLIQRLRSTGDGSEIEEMRLRNQNYLRAYKIVPLSAATYYKGKLQNNKKEGYGQLYGGSFNYFGHFQNDLPNGQGAILLEKTCTYGHFRAGILEGNVKEWNGQSKFQGIYKQGLRVRGKLICDSFVYEGDFKDDCLDGKGQMNMKQGGSYQGQFKEGKFHGKGVLMLSNGCKYDGSFKEGKYAGYGQFSWPNGNTYRGEYQQGLRHGFGVLKIDNYQYSGKWIKGFRQGKGILQHGSDLAFGDWKLNKMVENE